MLGGVVFVFKCLAGHSWMLPLIHFVFFFADVSHRVSTTAKQVDIFTSCVEKRAERELGQSNVAASLVTGWCWTSLSSKLTVRTRTNVLSQRQPGITSTVDFVPELETIFFTEQFLLSHTTQTDMNNFCYMFSTETLDRQVEIKKAQLKK